MVTPSRLALTSLAFLIPIAALAQDVPPQVRPAHKYQLIVQAHEVAPPELRPPQNSQLVLLVHAKGDQIYTCKGDSGQPSWTLKAPDAQLFDKDGKPVGKHFVGPSWEASDGSRVTGKAAANAPSPDPDSIPWLLVNVISHEGSGVLSNATHIQRLNTKGGKAPASGCDAAHVGQELRVPYSADYLFFAAK